MPRVRIDGSGDPIWQSVLRECEHLIGYTPLRFAAVAAAGFKGAAQRTDCAGIGGAIRHIFRLEVMFANRAADEVLTAPIFSRRTRDVETPFCHIRDRGGHGE